MTKLIFKDMKKMHIRNNKRMLFYFYIVIVIGSLSAIPQAPSLFHYNQGTFQAFYFFKDVMIDSIYVEADDWVGSFNCIEWNEDSTSCAKLGPCVGSRRWNTDKCGGGICDLPAIGTGGKSLDITKGYLDTGEYPTFLIYDQSHDVYYKTEPEGDVIIQKDVCRNGYPYCYGWENFRFYVIQTLNGTEIYMDCSGKLDGSATLDACDICGGSGPNFHCEENSQSYCTEYEYEQKCIHIDSK